MAYSVNWSTLVVTVSRSDLIVLSADPEVYALDTLDFWRKVHTIQEGEGLPYPAIMNSNAPVEISGTTLARTLEIINGYRIEFEDGPYEVRPVGTNNNIQEARVPNQVSISSSNSSGLVVGPGSGLSSDQDYRLRMIERRLFGSEDHLVSGKVTIRDNEGTVAEWNRTGTAPPSDFTLERT